MSELILLGERIKLIHLQSPTPTAAPNTTAATASNTTDASAKQSTTKQSEKVQKVSVPFGGGKSKHEESDFQEAGNERRLYRGVKVYNLTVSQAGVQDEKLQSIRSASGIQDLRRLQARFQRRRGAAVGVAASGARLRTEPNLGSYEQHCKRLKAVNTLRNRRKLHVFNDKLVDSIYQEYWGGNTTRKQF